MAMSDDPQNPNDPYQLRRFLEAQQDNFEQAHREINQGRKLSHWMWYIFPQFEGLGSSSTARRYSIKSLEEAKAYLNHPVLGRRLLQCAEAVLKVEGRSAEQIFGYPDDLKLRSCATLFSSVLPAGSVFDRVLEKYYAGRRDEKTLQLLGNPNR